MNRILALILMMTCAGLTACVQMPASRADMDKLGDRVENALIEQRRSAVIPVSPPAIADRKYTRVFTTNGGKTTFKDADGTEHIVANGYTETLEVTLPAGMNPNGIYDPGLPWPAAVTSRPEVTATTPEQNLAGQIKLLRGPNADQPPFFTVPSPPTPSAEDIRRAMQSPGYQPPKDGCRK